MSIVSTSAVSDGAVALAPPREPGARTASPPARATRLRRRLGTGPTIGLVLVILVVLVAIFAPLLAPYP
ncbi:MAG TPA: hypothetical protein VGK33_13420, partial [Chloroflexota bacterium]